MPTPSRLRHHLFALTLLALSPLAAAQEMSPYPAPPFFPPPAHPRLYFTARDLPRLLENSTKPQNAQALKEHLAQLKKGTDGRLPPPTDPAKGNMSSPVLAIIESYAFEYALRQNPEPGQKAIAALRNYISTVSYPPKEYNNNGQTIFTIAAVYDWCYPLLTPDDKQFFIQSILSTAATMEIGWPPVQQGNVTGHGPEGQIFRDLLAAGVATYNEKPDIYNLVAGRFFSKMVEPKKFMYPAHMHNQGVHYTKYRGQWELLATLIFDRMGLPQVFGPDQQYFMYWSMYARRGDGQLLRDGDQHLDSREVGKYYIENYRPLMLAANYFSDPYLKMEALHERPNFDPMGPNGNQALDAVETLIFNNPDLAPRPLAELPLTHYFPTPKGAMIARTGWEDTANTSPAASNAVVVEMKINEWYFGNHMHLDAGAFQIYYKGALATDSGYYQAGLNKTDNPENNGSSGYGSLYDVNYNKRSIAHNVVTVYDPNESFASRRFAKFKMANDGGQRFPFKWDEPKDFEDLINPTNGYHIAQVLAHDIGPDAKHPDYSYLKGDLQNAYSNKIKAYERSFVFLNLNNETTPAALIVFDRVVSSNPAFRKAFLLHGLEQPTISSNTTTFKDTRPGYTGKLTNTTLLPTPDNTTITPVGGPDHEAFVDGTNYPVLLKDKTVNEAGGWRIEVSPKTPSETDYFLNVLQLGTHTPDTTPLPIEQITSQTHAGLRIANRVVLLPKSKDPTSTPFSFSFTGQGTCQILLTDLHPGTWTLQQNNLPPTELTIPPTQKTAYFEGPPATYHLTPRKLTAE